MSDFGVYDVALSASEIASIMSTGISSGPSSGDSGGSVPVTPNDMIGDPGVFFVDLTWSPKNLARSYKIGYTGTDGSEGTLTTSETNAKVGSLTPDTEYVFTLLSSDGSLFTEYGSSTAISTLENLEANYDITDFQDPSGVTDLSSLDQGELEVLEEHVNELLETGDVVLQNVQSGSVETTFVNRGDTLDATTSGGSGRFMIPFTQSAGTGQEATISTGTEDIVVSYDETTDQVIVDGNSYANGESFIVDGKRMIVYTI